MADNEVCEVNSPAPSTTSLRIPTAIPSAYPAVPSTSPIAPGRCRFVTLRLYTPNPQKMADFYCKVLDLKEVERTDRSSIFVSDGYFNLALLYQRRGRAHRTQPFGFHVQSNEEMQSRAEKAGVRRGAKRPERISVCRVPSSRSRRQWCRHLAEGLAVYSRAERSCSSLQVFQSVSENLGCRAIMNGERIRARNTRASA